MQASLAIHARNRASTTVKTRRYKQAKTKRGSVQVVRDRATTKACAVDTRLTQPKQQNKKRRVCVERIPAPVLFHFLLILFLFRVED